MKQISTRPNYLGVRGWVWGGKYKIERYLYLLHRVTGLGLILYAILHLIETTFFRIQGQEVWEATMSFLDHPAFEVGLYLVVVAFIFHALNGFRLVLQELGFLLTKPSPPIYPYQDALRQKRPLVFVMTIFAVIIAVVFLINFVL